MDQICVLFLRSQKFGHKKRIYWEKKIKSNFKWNYIVYLSCRSVEWRPGFVIICRLSLGSFGTIAFRQHNFPSLNFNNVKRRFMARRRREETKQTTKWTKDLAINLIMDILESSYTFLSGSFPTLRCYSPTHIFFAYVYQTHDSSSLI